ncbi:MAG: tape measure protein, partial [Methylobacter sp.]
SIGQLRGMAEAGELTSDRLISALGKVAPSVAEKFNQLPLTVSQAMTQLNNAFTLYIGNADKSNGATTRLSGVISGVANNFNTIANAALLVAEIYGAKLAVGLVTSTQAFIANALSAKQKALADQQAALATQNLLQWEAKKAAISVENSLAMIREAQLQRALATTEEQRVLAVKALDAAYKQHAATVSALNTKNAALAASAASAAAPVGLLAKAFGLLNSAVSVLMAWEIGTQIGEWARQFEIVRLAGTYLAQAFVLAQAQISGFFNGVSLKDRFEEFKRINAEFDQIRQNSTAAAQQSAQSEQQHAQTVEQAQQQIQTSLAATEKAYEKFFTNLDYLYQREQQAVDQRQQQQTLELEKSVTDEQERARKVTDVIIAANQQRIQLANNYANERLRILDSIYNKEIEKARANGQSVEQIEKQLLTKKLSVLKTLEDATKQSIDRLIAEEQRHTQAAQAAAEQRKESAKNAEQELLGFYRESMDQQDKARSFQAEQETQWSRLRKAQAEGDFAEQQDIAKRLMDIALERGRVERDIAKETTGYTLSAEQQAKDSYEAAFNALQQALTGLQNAEEGAAAKSHDAATAASLTLDQIQERITKIQDALSKGTASTHSITDNSDEVMARIKRLDGVVTKSEHIIVEKVQREGQAAPSQSNQSQSDTVPADVPQARRYGGPIFHLNTGGKLPGWGGGDTVPAMLEPGEFVIRKEAVDKYGAGLFAQLNAMNANAGAVIKRRFGGIIPGFATGGSVGSDAVDQEKERRKQRLDAAVAENAKQQAARDQLKAEVDAVKKKIIELAGSSQYTMSPFGRQLSRPHSSDAGLDYLLDGASRAAFGGGAEKYLNTVTNAVQALVFKLRKAKLNFEDLPISGAFHIGTGNSDLSSQVGKLFADGVKKFAIGGSVPGVGDGDTVPAMLTPGEWVINKASVAKYGNAFMDAVNRGVLPKGFNAGGPVTPPASGGSVVVQFKAPDGQTAHAQFDSQSDVNQFLKVIKLSGGVTA